MQAYDPSQSITRYPNAYASPAQAGAEVTRIMELDDIAASIVNAIQIAEEFAMRLRVKVDSLLGPEMDKVNQATTPPTPPPPPSAKIPGLRNAMERLNTVHNEIRRHLNRFETL